MMKMLFRDSFIYFISSLLSRALGIFLIPLYTRVLDPSDYGSLDLFLIFAHILKLTVALEVAQGLARYLSEETDAARRATYTSTAFWFSFSAYSFCASVLFLNSGTLAAVIMGQPGLEKVFKVGLAFVWIQGAFYLVQTQLQFELMPKRYAGVSLLMAVGTAVFSLWFAIGLKMGLEGMLLGMTAGTAVAVVLGMWWLRHSLKFRFNRIFLAKMLSFSSPLVLSGIAAWATLYIDRLMIKGFLTLSDVGLYGLAYRISSIAGLAIFGFQVALTPLIYANHEKKEAPKQIATIFRIFVGCVLIVFLFFSLFAKQITSVLATAEYAGSASLIMFLVPAILLANMYIFAPGPAIAKRTSIFVKVNLFGLVLNVVLNTTLIPALGSQGAAISTLVAFSFAFVFYMATSQKLYPVPHSWGPIFASVFMFSFFVSLSPFLNLHGFVEAVFNLFILIFATLWIIVFGLIRPGELRFIVPTTLIKVFMR